MSVKDKINKIESKILQTKPQIKEDKILHPISKRYIKLNGNLGKKIIEKYEEDQNYFINIEIKMKIDREEEEKLRIKKYYNEEREKRINILQEQINKNNKNKKKDVNYIVQNNFYELQKQLN